jgi:hypothetical protein
LFILNQVWDIDRNHVLEPALAPPPLRTTAVFFAGTLRHKLCGLDSRGREVRARVALLF